MPKKKKEEEVIVTPGDILYKEFVGHLLTSKISGTIDRRRIKSGDVTIEYVTGGGFIRAGIVELAAQEGAGKTSLVWRVFTCMQGKILPSFGSPIMKGAYIDAEHALDYNYVLAQGALINLTNPDGTPDTQLAEMLDIRSEYYDQLVPEGIDIFLPDEGEGALDFIRRALQMNYYDMIVIDSKDALAPTAEIVSADKKGYKKAPQQARQAEMFSRFLRDSSRLMGKSKTCLVFISQMREKVGVVFGNPETTGGGRALKFYASIRLYMSTGNKMEIGGDMIGREPKLKGVKNKTAAPFKEEVLYSMNDIGTDVWRNAFTKGVGYGLIEKVGTRYSANWMDDGKSMPKEDAIRYLREHPQIYEILYTELLAMMNEKG